MPSKVRNVKTLSQRINYLKLQLLTVPFGRGVCPSAAAAAAATDNRRCVIHESCGRCLAANSDDQVPPVCGWCTDPLYDMRRPRCVSLAEQAANGTGCARVYVPQAAAMRLADDRETADFGGADGERPAVQIRPQRVRMALKRGRC